VRSSGKPRATVLRMRYTRTIRGSCSVSGSPALRFDRKACPGVGDPKELPRYRHCIARSSPPMPGIKRVAVVAYDGSYFSGSQSPPEDFDAASMIHGRDQYYVPNVARRRGLSNATNLFRGVPDWLRKYLDSGRRNAKSLENLFAISVVGCAVDAQTSKHQIIFVESPLRQPDRWGPALVVDPGGFHRTKRHTSAENDDRVCVFQGVRCHQPGTQRGWQNQACNDDC